MLLMWNTFAFTMGTPLIGQVLVNDYRATERVDHRIFSIHLC